MDYNELFCFNLTRLMQDQGLSKLELAKRAQISVSFVSDITTGKGNPSLKIMQSLANALKVPLPLFFLDPSGDMWTLWNTSRIIKDGSRIIKDGVEEITAILPSQKAFIVKKWAKEFQKNQSKE